jgi:hypothetical protein
MTDATGIEQVKDIARTHLRSLLPLEKIEKLVQLQEQYFQFLQIREKNGGKPIPEAWRKWSNARNEYAASRAKIR